MLNIGAGGGREVLNALHHGAQRVIAVDVSDVVIHDIMQGHLREFSGDLYGDPRVRAVADEGRSFSERSRERFDLVDFSIGGGGGGTFGGGFGGGGTNLEKMERVRWTPLHPGGAAHLLERLTRMGLLLGDVSTRSTW